MARVGVFTFIGWHINNKNTRLVDKTFHFHEVFTDNSCYSIFIRNHNLELSICPYVYRAKYFFKTITLGYEIHSDGLIAIYLSKLSDMYALEMLPSKQLVLSINTDIVSTITGELYDCFANWQNNLSISADSMIKYFDSVIPQITENFLQKPRSQVL